MGEMRLENVLCVVLIFESAKDKKTPVKHGSTNRMAKRERATGADDHGSTSDPCWLFVDAHDASGGTALCVASSRGHEDIVKLLLAHGASADAAAGGGDTPLICAARRGHLPIVKTLLDCHAAPDAVNDNGGSAVIAAGSSGHFDVVELLISAGASVDGRAVNGETLLLAAARWRNMETLLSIVNHAQMKAFNGVHSLILASLQSLEQYGRTNVEFSTLWSGIIDRLFGFLDGVQDGGLSGDVTFRSMRIMGMLGKLNTNSESRRLLHRLADCRTVFKTIRDIHAEIDELTRSANATTAIPSHRDDSENWRLMLEQDEREVLETFDTTLHDDAQLQCHLANEDDHTEAIALLQYEISVHSDQCSSKLLELLKLTLDRVLRVTGTEAAALPAWFLPTREFEFGQPEAEVEGDLTTGRLRRGEWLSSDVTMFQSPMAQEQFKTAIDRWFPLSHLNVVNLFGASHVRQPRVAVFEDISSFSLRDYLRVEKNRYLVWQKLYEVALGLRYLHERGVMVGAFSLDSMWIGADGLAKIAAVGANLTSPVSGMAGEDAVRWMSPEVLRGEAPSAASDVYSFGWCISDAISDGEACPKPPIDSSSLLNISSPSPCQLIASMCSFDPSMRPTALTIAGHLKKFADDRIQESANAPAAHLDDEELIASLWEWKFSKLGTSTIAEYLESLKGKCAFCNDFEELVSQVFARLADISSHFRKMEMPPECVAVKMFASVLHHADMVLRFSVGMNTSAVRARNAMSQRVSMTHHLLHKQIDEVLEFIPATNVNDEIHNWSGTPKSGKRVTYRKNGVTLTEFVSRGANQQLKTFGVDTVASKHPWLLPLHEVVYQKEDAFAWDSFARIYRGEWLRTRVVIKCLYEDDRDFGSPALFFHELRIWNSLNHPHIVKLFGACHRNTCFFVCEYASNGTLTEFLTRYGNANKTWQKLYEVALGFQYLHGLNIIHNDLKCANLLIGDDGKAKITGFELSSILNTAELQIDPKSQGIVHWKSPEYLRGERPTLVSDIYSFGICILEAVTGEPPWRNMVDVAVRFQVLRKGNLPRRPETMTDTCGSYQGTAAAGADANVTDFEGYTPLLSAVHSGRADIVKVLLRHEAATNAAADASGCTPLRYALVNRNSAMVNILVEAGDVNEKPSGGYPLMVWPLRYDNLDAVNILLAAGADVNAACPRGSTLLHIASWSGVGIEIIEEPIAHNADGNAVDDTRISPLECALLSDRPDIVRVLLAAGATRYHWFHAPGVFKITASDAMSRVFASLPVLTTWKDEARIRDALPGARDGEVSKSPQLGGPLLQKVRGEMDFGTAASGPNSRESSKETINTAVQIAGAAATSGAVYLATRAMKKRFPRP